MEGKSVAEIIQLSNVKFGTSGARGLVSQFNDSVTAAFAVAFVGALEQQSGKVSRLALGIDRRPSSPKMAEAICGVLSALGIQVDYYGVLPTPALALKALEEGVPAIMVTGSHIPFDRNGIKFYRPDGEIAKQDEQAILTNTSLLPDFLPCSMEVNSSAKENYVARYTDAFPSNLLSGWKVGVYEHSAAGRDLSKEILLTLGAEVVSLGRTDIFVPIDTEAVSKEDQEQAIRWSQEYALDAIFSTDGDGDRPLIADEKGEWIKGDVVGMLCAKFIGANSLAVPVSCNSSIEDFLNIQVTRTKIGSPYVIAGMSDLMQGNNSKDVVAGFEANGGFLCATPFVVNNVVLPALPTRDALLPLIALLSEASSQSIELSGLVKSAATRYTDSNRLCEFPVEESRALLRQWTNDINHCLSLFGLPDNVIHVNNVDGLRIVFQSGEVVHFRPSGNAPELRCYCESNSKEAVSDLLENIMNTLSKIKRRNFDVT